MLYKKDFEEQSKCIGSCGFRNTVKEADRINEEFKENL